MFDRLQIFHQKKNSTVFKGSQKKNEKAAREVYSFWSRANLKYAMAHGSLHSY